MHAEDWSTPGPPDERSPEEMLASLDDAFYGVGPSQLRYVGIGFICPARNPTNTFDLFRDWWAKPPIRKEN